MKKAWRRMAWMISAAVMVSSLGPEVGLTAYAEENPEIRGEVEVSTATNSDACMDEEKEARPEEEEPDLPDGKKESLSDEEKEARPEEEKADLPGGKKESLSDEEKEARPEEEEADLPDEKNRDLTPEEIERTVTTHENLSSLWEDWIDGGTLQELGEGTEEYPYRISNVEELMIVSHAVAVGEEEAVNGYYELAADLDLSCLSTYWHPIGWYQSEDELSGGVRHPFRGTFDGAGHTISGLKIVNYAMQLQNVGLFGVIEGGCVRNLSLEADGVYGYDNIGILAGQILGKSNIYDVVVSGVASSGGLGGSYAADAHVGGITGQMRGSGSAGSQRAVIENCRADGIYLNTYGKSGYTGGIAGSAVNAYIVDSQVQAGNESILGQGYVGGIAGFMTTGTSLYNVSSDGIIGGSGAKAVGGIVGYYTGGEIVTARVFGRIGKTNMAVAREGIFVGTRDVNTVYTYGTTAGRNLAYLFTTADNRTRNIIGSGVSKDNIVPESAHIGYWNDHEVHYCLKNEKLETYDAGRYFYEELEDGIRNIVTVRLGRQFTTEEYADGLPFSIDHYAPGNYGEPQRGCLLSVDRVDAQNSNGTYDQDVATLVAYPGGTGSFYRIIDKDQAAAVQPGVTVQVTTAAKNTLFSRYQMIVDEQEAGGVIPPVYTDEEGNERPMTYQNGGGYSFVMPECDTTLRAEYIKVTTELSLNPEKIGFHIVQTRSGDRKNPSIVTTVLDDRNKQLASFTGLEYYKIHVDDVFLIPVPNNSGTTADNRVIWSVDDADLIVNHSDSGYVITAGRFAPNMNSAWLAGVIREAEQKQKENGYQQAIPATVFSRSAVCTAATDPATSGDGQAVFANCTVEVDFKILDLTTLRVEQIRLDRESLTATITRTLSGDRRNPTDTITADLPKILTASLYPAQSFTQSVRWEDERAGQYLRLEPSGVYGQNCKIQPVFDPQGKKNPAWIQNVIDEDDQIRKTNPGKQIHGTASYTETISVTAADVTNGYQTAECRITIHFVTVDHTVMPQQPVSSGGGGGGGGGGSAKSVTGGGLIQKLPDYVKTGGVWSQTAEGRWQYTGDHVYANEWAAIENPYANTENGQASYDWYHFDEHGCMMTGWYTDENGDIYYLSPVSDGTQGRMVTGRNQIDGIWYSFTTESNGKKGSLIKSPSDKQ